MDAKQSQKLICAINNAVPVGNAKHIATFETRIEERDDSVLIIHVPVDVDDELREHINEKIYTVMFFCSESVIPND